MCLAVPAKIITQHAGDEAVVDLHGNRVTVSTIATPGVTPGDWVLIHAGFSIQQLQPEEAQQTWSVLNALPPGNTEDAS